MAHPALLGTGFVFPADCFSLLGNFPARVQCSPGRGPGARKASSSHLVEKPEALGTSGSLSEQLGRQLEPAPPQADSCRRQLLGPACRLRSAALFPSAPDRPLRKLWCGGQHRMWLGRRLGLAGLCPGDIAQLPSADKPQDGEEERRGGGGSWSLGE